MINPQTSMNPRHRMERHRQRATRDTLKLAEDLFGREARSFRESVRLAAERIGTERGLSPAVLAREALELAVRPEGPC